MILTNKMNFLIAKQVVKERQDTAGSNCLKSVSGIVIVDEKGISRMQIGSGTGFLGNPYLGNPRQSPEGRKTDMCMCINCCQYALLQ